MLLLATGRDGMKLEYGENLGGSVGRGEEGTLPPTLLPAALVAEKINGSSPDMNKTRSKLIRELERRRDLLAQSPGFSARDGVCWVCDGSHIL